VSEIVERFRRVHLDAPGRALIHVPVTGRTLTADDVLTACAEHTRALQRCGLGSDSLVMLVIGNRPAAFPFWLACRAAGVAVLPVDTGIARTEFVDIARRFGATLAVVPDGSGALPAGAEPETFCDGLLALRFDDVSACADLHRGAAVLKLTSGSTGLPKATFTTERELVTDAEQIIEAMDIAPAHTQIAAIPLSHAYGIGNLLMPALIQGTPVVLRDGFVPHALPGDARAYGANVFPGVPFMFEHLAASPPPGGWPPSLRKLVSAGARLEVPSARRFFDAFGVKIHSFYGTTETGGIAYDDSPDLPDDTSVGRPLPGVRITLRREDSIPEGSGRVHVTGDAVARGYAGGDDSSDGSFVAGGFLTGDLGHFDTRGHLVLTGRVSQFINVAGRKVQPEEVEEVLRAMPAVTDVRVIAAPDHARGQQIAACIVAAETDRNVLAIRQFCAARLAVYKLPRVIVWLDRIPVTERGKTDRARLDALVREEIGRAGKTGML
jgi:acyl-CoA synthetase (AMP-forming)/AMP-acid ligase II